MLNIGDTAPDFTLPATENDTFTLSSLRGKKVILYFYPKDDTPGCTTQACGFRDSFSDFIDKNAVVVGVSKDNLKRHAKFKEKYDLPFTLLSDEDGAVCSLYETWVKKSMYGREYFGIERSTFLIDEEGKIENLWRKVKVPGHVEKILAAVSLD